MKKELRERVWLKHDKRCAFCGKELEYKDMQVDHLTPKTIAHLYGNEKVRKYMEMNGDNINSFENLMPSCRRCNHYKRAQRLEDFRDSMKSLHKRVEKQYITKVAIDYGVVKIIPFSGIFYFEMERPEKK